MSTVSSPASALAIGSAPRNEIVFIESNVEDYQILEKGIDSGKEIHVLDAATDGLAQMVQILAGRSGIDAIHIISHGSTGAVQLGTLTLDDETLQNRKADLSAIGQSLTGDGDLLLYGCNVAKGQSGIDSIGQLAQATGAEVAASDDLTGHAAKNGDWVLETRTGNIGAAALGAPGNLEGWDHVMAAPFITQPGSLAFNAGVDYATGNSPRSVTSADVNGDGEALVVMDNVDTDTLTHIERLQFADTKLAIDFDGNAGLAMEFIGVVAPNLLDNTAVRGQILALFDAGETMQTLCQRAIDLHLVPASNADLATTIYQNVLAKAPTAEVTRTLTDYIDTHGQADFLSSVAGMALNIDLVGLQKTGVEYV